MPDSSAFGPNLRRLRLTRGVSLESISAATKVPVSLWESLEDNDFYGWPSGVLARAFVREYARLIGAEPDEIVDEFCRLFPHGDRRGGNLMEDLAARKGQSLVWSDELPVSGERRRSVQPLRSLRTASRRHRLVSAAVDASLVAAVGLGSARLLPWTPAARLALFAIVYCVSCMGLNRSVGTWVAAALMPAGGAPFWVRLRRAGMRSDSASPARTSL